LTTFFRGKIAGYQPFRGKRVSGVAGKSPASGFRAIAPGARAACYHVLLVDNALAALAPGRWE